MENVIVLFEVTVKEGKMKKVLQNGEILQHTECAKNTAA